MDIIFQDTYSHTRWKDKDDLSCTNLSPNNCITTDSILQANKTKRILKEISLSDERFGKKTQLITPFSLEVVDLTQLFDNIVLSPNEQLIIEALQIIEPNIERIASVKKLLVEGNEDQRVIPELIEAFGIPWGETKETAIGDETYLTTAEHLQEVGTIVVMQDITYVKQLEKDRSDFLHFPVRYRA